MKAAIRARKLQEDEIEIGKCKQMIAAEKLQLVKQKERERAKLERWENSAMRLHIDNL
jgi:hypothetical protein